MPIPQLDALKARLVAYARFVEDMIEKSKKALVARQVEMLREIIDSDEPRANEFEMDLEEECTSLIAQHQPMAHDLRTMLMILRITNDLERIADLSTNIGEDVIYMAEGRVIKHHRQEEKQ